MKTARWLLLFLLATVSSWADVVLYYLPQCPYSRQVLDYLEQIGKTVTLKNVQGSEQLKEELVAVGGRAQVPCLVVDGQALYNADAIIEWLSEHQEILGKGRP
jgi:glutaredoxin